MENYNKIEVKRISDTSFIVLKTSIEQSDTLTDKWNEYKSNRKNQFVIKDTKLKVVKGIVYMTVIYYINEM